MSAAVVSEPVFGNSSSSSLPPPAAAGSLSAMSTSTPSPTPGSSSADSAENLRIMMEGRVFDRFVLVPSASSSPSPDSSAAASASSGTVQKESIFLYYEPSLKLGSFYWCQPGQRERRDDSCIPLASISDIFLGRQTPELKAAIAAGGAADTCFSITSKRQSLHLRAESASVRSAFLSGIRHVWTKPSAAMVQTPNIQAMMTGSTFISVTKADAGGIDRRDIFLWYESSDSKLGTVYWCDAGGSRTKVKDQTLQLHRISDVFLGKQATELKGAEAVSFPSHQCFSIVAKDKAVHLVAPSEAMRTTWLAGIKDVFANVGKISKDSKDRKSGPPSLDRAASKQATAAAAVAATPSPPPAAASGAVFAPAGSFTPIAVVAPASPTAAASPVKPQLSVQPPSEPAASIDYFTPRAEPAQPAIPPADRPSALEAPGSAFNSPTTAAAVASLQHETAVVRSKTTLLERGHVFTAFVGISPTVRRRVFVWYDDKDGKLGTLYWNDREDGVKLKTAEQSIPFHRISDVFMGKQSLELKSQEAAGVESNVCFSVVSKDKALHLAAESAAVRLDFLSNIKQIFLLSGKRVDEERQRQDRRKGDAATAPAPLPELRSEYLEAGQRFMSYEDDAVVLDVLVWYANNGDELGYLYWSATGRKEESENNRIAVPFISDIYLGKQTPQLEAYTAADAPDNCCFSLVSADRALHLKALTPGQRTDFLSALRDLFILAGKRTQQEAQELSIQQALLTNPKRALLMQGSTFIGLFGSDPTERRQVLVWLAPEDAKSGTLYWSSDGQRERSSERSLPLHRVSDVFMGKQTPELKSEQARDISTNRCFSILTRDRGLHLAAADEQQRGDWLSAIKSVFVESGKRVDDEKERAKARKEREAAERAAAAKSTIAPNQEAINKEAALLDVYSPQPGAVAPVDALIDGRDYLAIFPAPAASASSPPAYWSRPVHVFFVAGEGDSIGRLFWCDRGRKERLEEQSMPLSRVSDVFIGKHTEELKSAEGGRYDSRQCVSLVSKQLKERSLHLVAKDEKARDEFVTSLRAAFARAARPGNLSDPAAIVAMMSAGEEVVSYIGSGIIGSSCPALLWFAPKDGKLGTIYWNEELKKEKVAGLSLAVNHLVDLFLGKKTPELLSVEGLFANGDHCLSLMSRKNSLHVEFKTTQLRDAWLTGVKNAYAAAGRIVKESKPGDAPGTRITTIVSQRKPDAVRVSPVLLEGRPFVRYQLVAGALKKKRIHLWLVKQDGPLGTLYWEDMLAGQGAKQPLDKKPENSISVARISDVYIGKQTPLFQHAELGSVPVDCCLSIASKEQTLDLAAKYPKDRKEWLTAIHTVFISSGKKVVENEPAITKVVMDQPVWTPYGKGLAERWPRSDGITAVQLDWGVAYCNLQSLHRLVHVMTPLGQAILLPGDLKREDDTIQVQLPWGVSFVKKKDVVPLKSTSAPSSRQTSPHQSGSSTPVAAPSQPTAAASMLPSIRPVAVGGAAGAGSKEPKRDYTKEEAVAVLSRGVPFTLIGGSDPAVPTASLVVAWLNANDGVLGSLYYNPAGNGAAHAEHSLPVHLITDLYLGSLNFPSPSHHSDRAMSIVSREDAWHLLAESTEQRNLWYFALHSLISSSGKDVVSEEKPSPAASGVSSHHFHYAKPAEPDYREATATLRRGGRFTQHFVDAATGERRAQAVDVWYDVREGEFGALCTGSHIPQEEKTEEKERREAAEAVWRLDDIRDLFLGSRNFRKDGGGVSVENDCCLSLVLRDNAALNLEAATKQQRDSIFYSIISVLKHGPKLDDDDGRDSRTPSVTASQQRRHIAPLTPTPQPSAVLVPAVMQPVPESQLQKTSDSAAGQLNGPASSSSPAVTPQPLVVSGNVTPTTGASPSSSSSIVAEGVEMTVWVGDEQSSTGTRQFVYWEAPSGKRRLGTLCWCPAGSRQRVDGQELPLHYISDVFLGRHSAALKSPEAASAAVSSCCFVLVSKSLVFSAQCNSDKERDQWLKAFKRMFTQGGKAIVQQKTVAASASSSAASTTPRPAAAAAPTAQPDRSSTPSDAAATP